MLYVLQNPWEVALTPPFSATPYYPPTHTNSTRSKWPIADEPYQNYTSIISLNGLKLIVYISFMYMQLLGVVKTTIIEDFSKIRVMVSLAT